MYKMTLLSKIKPHSDAVDYFKELPFNNKPIEKPTCKCLKNIEMSYKVEIFERKDPIVLLEASKLSIKDLFSDLLNEAKGFKYQITVKVLLENTNSMFVSIQ